MSGEVRLGLMIKRAEQALIVEKTRVLRSFDLTVPQYAALMVLLQTPEASAARLARACCVTPQTMATVLGNLEVKGLVAREISPLHQRVRATQLTPPGRALARRADRAVLAVERRLAAVFTEAEFDRFADYLERATTAMARQA